jgi:hypothetical protein
MNYKVKLNTSNNIHVGVKNATVRRSVEINTSPTESTGNITIDPSNKQNNSVLVYDSNTNTHKYLQPQQIIDLADGNLNNAIDYGSY